MSNEDDDDSYDSDAAAKFRQLLRGKALETFDPLHQSLLEMEALADSVGIDLDYDQDLSDIEDPNCW
jgi:hypothetical protein